MKINKKIQDFDKKRMVFKF